MTSVPSTMDSKEPPQMSPRAARSRAKMLEAATALLVESGSRSVTVDAVSEASGVAKSTLYRHWSSRTELLIDVVKSNAHATERPDPELGFEAALRSLIASAARSFGAPEWVKIFPSVASLRTSIPELDAFFEADIADKKRALEEVLSLGVAEGVVDPGFEADNAASLLIGPLIFGALTLPNGGDSVDCLRRLGDHAVDCFIKSHRPADS